jgi:hypothetical protein
VGTTLDGSPARRGDPAAPEEERVTMATLDVTSRTSVGICWRMVVSGRSTTWPVRARWASRSRPARHLGGECDRYAAVADALATRGARACRVLVISSAEVYGSVPVEEQPVRRAGAPAPATPYGSHRSWGRRRSRCRPPRPVDGGGHRTELQPHRSGTGRALHLPDHGRAAREHRPGGERAGAARGQSGGAPRLPGRARRGAGVRAADGARCQRADLQRVRR